jgi:hypothetical protein
MKRLQTMPNVRVLGMVFILIIVLTGCSNSPEKSRKPNKDFSRGLPLATNVSSSIAYTVEPAGDRVQVVIPYLMENTQPVFRYIQLNEQVDILLDFDIDCDLENFARSPRMVSNGEYLHLIWASREDTSEGWQLKYLMVDQQGKAVSLPQGISEKSQSVSQYQIVSDLAGGAIILWEEAGTGKIKYSQISSAGKLISPVKELVEGGEDPSLGLDQEGNYHLVWMDGDDLKYREFGLLETFPLSGNTLARIPVTVGNVREGPVLGFDNGFVYVFWSILKQTGLEAGTASTEYVVFETGNPGRLQKQRLNIYPDSEGLFESYQGDYNLSQLIPPPQEDYFSTNFVYAPNLNSTSGNALAVAIAANQEVRLDDYIQIAVGIFSDGEYQGYTLATKTTPISLNAVVERDQAGNLYLIWHEGAAGKNLFYSTTSPQGKAALDRFSFSDLPNLILSSSLEAVIGVLLFPFAFPWMFVGLAIMIIWRLVRNDEDLSLPLSRLLLVIAVISYQASKILFLPDVILYVPFSAWMDVPQQWGLVLRVGVPLLIFILGIAVAEWRRRQQDSSPSTLSYYFSIVIVDIVLTLAIYGVIFLGEY